MVISIQNVSCSYHKDKKPILNTISLDISKGECIALLGRNGSGKSTLAACMMGLIPHALPAHMSGDVYIKGKNTKKTDIGTIVQSIGMVFQDPNLVIFNPTIYEEVLFGVENLHLDSPHDRVRQALRDVGLEGYDERDPHTLSEGQKQKLCIACVLAMGTDALILDEPISHLDYTNALMIYDLLHVLHKKGKTIIVIEHDTDFVVNYTDRTCILHNGKIVIDGPSKKVLTQKEQMKQYGIKPVHIPKQF